MSTQSEPTDINTSPIARFVTTDTFAPLASWQLPFPLCHCGGDTAEPCHSLMFSARPELSHGGVFHFAASAITKKRGPGYEVAGTGGGRTAAADAPRSGANLRNRTYVPPLGSIAEVILRSVAQRLRLHAMSARSSRGDGRNSHTR
jgi:hypothetical protein